MQILSTKLEASNDKPADLDINSVTTDTDFSLSLANTKPETKPEKNTSPVEKPLKTKEDTDTTVSIDSMLPVMTNPMLNDMNQLISQIDLVNKANNNNDVSLETGVAEDAAEELLLSKPLDQSDKVLAFTTMPQELSSKINTSEYQEQQIQDIQNQQNKQAENIATAESSKIMTQDKNIQSFEKMTKVKNSSTVDTLLAQQFNSEIPLENKGIQSNPLASSLSSNPTQDLSKDQDNKYVASLTQLGSLINSYTAQHAHQTNDPILPAQLASTQSDYAETLRQAQLTELDTHVQLLPQSLESHLRDTYNANIKLYPPDLGHVLARLKIEGNSAQLIISAESDKVKGIIESNMSQLRENFQNANINLTHIQVEVSASQDKDHKHGQNNPQSHPNFEANEQKGELVKGDLTPKLATQSLNSIIDAYI